MADIGSGDARPLVFEQRGRASQIVGLAVSNWLLTLFTAGFYRFWARTRVRRYLWGTTFINEGPLDYTGQGAELFWAFIVAMAILFAPLIAFAQLAPIFGFTHPVEVSGWVAAIGLGMVVVGNAAIYRARGYVLSRTRWRGIRFAQSGSGVSYGVLALVYSFLSLLTLGLFIPFASVRLVGRMRRNSWIGNRRFDFAGSGWPLLGPFLVSALVTIIAAVAIGVAAEAAYMPVYAEIDALEPGWNLPPEKIAALLLTVLPLIVGIYLIGGIVISVVWAYYGAYRLNYLAQCTSLESVRFRMKATGLSLMWLRLGNFLIVTLTLGIGVPFAQVRVMRYMIHRLEADGELDLEATQQATEEQPRLGEGVADGLNILPV